MFQPPCWNCSFGSGPCCTEKKKRNQIVENITKICKNGPNFYQNTFNDLQSPIGKTAFVRTTADKKTQTQTRAWTCRITFSGACDFEQKSLTGAASVVTTSSSLTKKLDDGIFKNLNVKMASIFFSTQWEHLKNPENLDYWRPLIASSVIFMFWALAVLKALFDF